MSNLFSNVSSFDLQELVLDNWSDVSQLEQKKEVEDDLTGNDLHWAKINNQCLNAEIKIIKQTILAIKAEIYSRVRIK